LIFLSFLTVMTNEVAKLQLFGSLGATLSLFEHYGAKMKMVGSLGFFFFFFFISLVVTSKLNFDVTTNDIPIAATLRLFRTILAK
jgi:hypothetical protein